MGRHAHVLYLTLVAGVLATAVGCGPQFGAGLVALGLVPDEEVPAEFKIPPGPILILVDDDLDLVQPPLARLELVDELAKQFKKHEIAERVTTNQEIAQLRQETEDFDKLSIREVGRRANADHVLWMSVEHFALEEDLELVVEPASFIVRLKVFNARAENRRDVRLWPPEREGRMVRCEVSHHEIRKCKTLAEVHRLIAQEMADKIAKLFYDHTVPRE